MTDLLLISVTGAGDNFLTSEWILLIKCRRNSWASCWAKPMNWVEMELNLLLN